MIPLLYFALPSPASSCIGTMQTESAVLLLPIITRIHSALYEHTPDSLGWLHGSTLPRILHANWN